MKIQFSEQSESRYSRHEMIPWWDQNVLRNSRVLVVGAGAIGNEVLKTLALMGVGAITVVDFDTIETSNLTRTILFRDEDVGKSKARTAAERIHEINPQLDVDYFHGDIEFDVGEGLFASVDLVVGCLDNINARMALNAFCMETGVAWLNGAISDIGVEVSLHSPKSGACYHCILSEEAMEILGTRYSCSGLRLDLPPERMPTTAVVASLAGALLSNETVSLLHQANSTPPRHHAPTLKPGQRVVLSTRPYSFGIYSMPRSEECYLHGSSEEVKWFSQDLACITMIGLQELTGFHSKHATLHLGFRLAKSARCNDCGSITNLMRPAKKLSASVLSCQQCGGLRDLDAIECIDSNSDLALIPLRDLCVPPYPILQFTDEHGHSQRIGRKPSRGKDSTIDDS